MSGCSKRHSQHMCAVVILDCYTLYIRSDLDLIFIVKMEWSEFQCRVCVVVCSNSKERRVLDNAANAAIRDLLLKLLGEHYRGSQSEDELQILLSPAKKFVIVTLD